MTISANQLVQSLPSVLAPGGSNLVMNGLILTENTRVPIGTVPSFPNQAAVATYFGAQSAEAGLATYYFNGYDNSQQKPAALLFAQFPYAAAVGAYIRGASFGGAAFASSSISSGTLSIVIDGGTFSASGINLVGLTSYSAVAAAIQTALQAAVPTVATASAATVAGTILTVAGTLTGNFAVGQVITGAGITANSIITALGTGTGGAGTYTLSQSSTVGSGTAITGKPQLPTVTFDSVSSAYVITSGSTGTTSTIAFSTASALVTYLGLASGSGAVLSQGAALANIPTAMSAIYAITKNWVSFMTVFEPSTVDKVAFAAWTSPKPLWYAMWDTLTAAAAAATNDTTSAGYQIRLAEYNGTLPIYLDPNTAAFTMGAGASVNYNQARGRVTLAYRTQAGLLPTVTDDTTAANLLANGYNFYGSYANAGNGFICFQNGQISGTFDWWDSYTNEIWLNNNIQTSLIYLMIQQGNIPYNQVGYTAVRHALVNVANQANGSQPNGGALLGPIGQAVNFGAIQAGVILSAGQVSAVNAAAGQPIDGILFQVGYFILVADPGAQARLQRASPIVTVWYVDGQSIQKITVNSVNVQ